jgi:hypothetical protein
VAEGNQGVDAPVNQRDFSLKCLVADASIAVAYDMYGPEAVSPLLPRVRSTGPNVGVRAAQDHTRRSDRRHLPNATVQPAGQRGQRARLAIPRICRGIDGFRRWP